MREPYGQCIIAQRKKENIPRLRRNEFEAAYCGVGKGKGNYVPGYAVL
jgi:hypothetical protein